MRWLLDGSLATLQGRIARARLDLARPRLGLTEWSFDGQRPIDARLLGLELEGTPDEVYLREGDLFAIYEPTADRPNRVEACWRILSRDDLAALPRIELQVSVQTALLDSYPCLDCGSEIPAGACLRCSLDDQFLPLTTSFAVAWTPHDSQSCTLARQVDAQNLSYCEMVYPADFRVDHCRPMASGGVTLRHELFPEFLEKGVILRSRLRGLWLAADRDVDLARAAWHDFCASPLPLTA